MRLSATDLKDTVDAWVTAAGIAHGRVFRAINKAGQVWGDGTLGIEPEPVA